MPFPRTWSEELIAEWLQLEGYFVDVGVPIRSGPGGGRSEADVIGARINNEILEIFHIEVGQLSGNPEKNAATVREKFSQDRISAIKEYCIKKLQFSTDKQPFYKSLYVAVWRSDKTESYLKQLQLPVTSLWEFIENNIKPTIKGWKNKAPHKPQISGTVTIPESMWLLYLIDYLERTSK